MWVSGVHEMCFSEVGVSLSRSAGVEREILNMNGIETVILTLILIVLIYILLRHLDRLLRAVHICLRLCLCPYLVLCTVPDPYPYYSSSDRVSLSRVIVTGNVSGTSIVISFFSCRDRGLCLCRRLVC